MVQTTNIESKAELRRSMLHVRREIPTERLFRLSEAVLRNVVSSTEFEKATTIASYVAKKDEVRTEGIIKYSLEVGKRVIVPVTIPPGRNLAFSELRDYDKELAPGSFDVLEPKKEHLRPIPLDDADLVLVPLVAWDYSGHRLGYGKGYFDSALARVGMSTFTMGLALECQRASEIPSEAHDVKLMAVATEMRIVRPVSRRGDK